MARKAQPPKDDTQAQAAAAGTEAPADNAETPPQAPEQEAMAATDEPQSQAPEEEGGTEAPADDAQAPAPKAAGKDKATPATTGRMVEAKLLTRHCSGGICKEKGETMRMTQGEYARLKQYGRVE